MIAEAVARLDARVPDLAGRVRGAAEFAALMQSNAFRDAQAGAYVLPTGGRGGQVRASAGAFVQDTDMTLAVVLVLPATDPRARRTPGALEDLSAAVKAALAGWRPADATAPMRLVREGTVNVGAGVLVYQIDFAAPSQLRIAP